MAGFYKNDNGILLEALSAIYNKNYELLIEDKDTYTYPIDGWKYFDTRDLALTEYGITEKTDKEI
jgi:hypothetical protein